MATKLQQLLKSVSIKQKNEYLVIIIAFLETIVRLILGNYYQPKAKFELAKIHLEHLALSCSKRLENINPVIIIVSTVMLIATAAIAAHTGYQKKETARDTAQNSLTQNEYQQKILLDNIPYMAWLKDKESRYIAVNEPFAKACKIKPDELIGKTDLDIFSVDLAQRYRHDDQEVMKTGKHKLVEEIITNQEGKTIWLEINKTPIFNDQNEVIGITGIAQDITERKQAEQELRQSETKFREAANREALINKLAHLIRNSLDLDTILKTAVVEIRTLLQIDRCAFIWHRPDAIHPHWEIVQEDKNTDLSSFINNCLPVIEIVPLATKICDQEIIAVVDTNNLSNSVEQEFFLSLEYRAVLLIPIHTQSGEIGVISCSHTHKPRLWSEQEINLLSGVAAQLAIAIDQAQLLHQSSLAVTAAQEKAANFEKTLHELQQTQAQLIQSEKMSSLGMLVAGIAHEINNPINFISGNLAHATEYSQDLLNLVQLYAKHYPQPIAEIQDQEAKIDLGFIQEDLPKIISSMKKGAERIRQIVVLLRNFSRLDEAEKKWVNIHEGIDNTLLILAHRLSAKSPDSPSIQVIKDYGNLPAVQCYAGQLNQVFMNILTNAIDAINGYRKKYCLEELKNYSGTILISTLVFQSDYVIIMIGDNGLGMPPEVCHKVFDPFYTTKPVGSATGLGMSISYKIVVEQHRGELQCISAPGKGTAFLIQIPIQQPSNHKKKYKR